LLGNRRGGEITGLTTETMKIIERLLKIEDPRRRSVGRSVAGDNEDGDNEDD
jgi:hypothetical protein